MDPNCIDTETFMFSQAQRSINDRAVILENAAAKFEFRVVQKVVSKNDIDLSNYAVVLQILQIL
ncbi:hypothetical protein PS15p_209816 [Mucor circinelloides]